VNGGTTALLYAGLAIHVFAEIFLDATPDESVADAQQSDGVWIGWACNIVGDTTRRVRFELLGIR
jgi:hypothetical protein